MRTLGFRRGEPARDEQRRADETAERELGARPLDRVREPCVLLQRRGQELDRLLIRELLERLRGRFPQVFDRFADGGLVGVPAFDRLAPVQREPQVRRVWAPA